jgi:maltodextrin utilization protein YvdJ
MIMLMVMMMIVMMMMIKTAVLQQLTFFLYVVFKSTHQNWAISYSNSA